MPYYRNKSLQRVVEEPDPKTRLRFFREWLDTFYLSRDQQLILNEEPILTGTVWDAIVAAAAAWLARKANLEVPAWTYGRKAKTPWFEENEPHTRSARIHQVLAPPEFFARNLFVSAKIMYRARMPRAWIEDEPQFFAYLSKKRLADLGF